MMQRIWGLFYRYMCLYRRNVARLGDVVFWPIMELLVWGFMTTYLQQSAASDVALFLLGGVIFWDVLYRAQLAISLSFTEEIWTRNLTNLFLTPISLPEYALATSLVGLARGLIGFLLLGVLASVLYAFDIWRMGIALAPSLASLLLFGWAVGMGTTGLILRFGKAAEALVWGIPFLFQPLVAVFYPVSVLPSWLQPVALSIPATHIFEGMRHTLATGQPDWAALARAFGLNLIWLLAAGGMLSWMLHQVRQRGALGKLGME